MSKCVFRYEDYIKAKERHANGEPFLSISKDLGLSLSTVWRNLNYGHPQEHHDRMFNEVKEYMHLFETGNTWQFISKVYMVSPNTIANRIKRFFPEWWKLNKKPNYDRRSIRKGTGT